MAKDTESFVPWCKGFRTLFYVERQSFALSALKVKGWGLWPTPEPFLPPSQLGCPKTSEPCPPRNRYPEETSPQGPAHRGA